VTKRILIACLATLAFSTAQAGDITFLNPQHDVTAIATTSDGLAGFDFQTSPPSAAPIFASADSLGTTDVATAGAIGGPGLLSTSADVTAGIEGIATATALSHFMGSFVLGAAEPFIVVDFTPFSFEIGSGNATTSLFVKLTSGATTVFSGAVDGPWGWRVTPGTTYVLDLLLSSEATAGFNPLGEGNASSTGLATVASAVPLPAPWLLLLVGLGPIAAARKRAARARGI
jgi:hypothetical protein